MNDDLKNISPIDGRYKSKTSDLNQFFSEYALIKYRAYVEIKWLIFMLLNNIINIQNNEKLIKKLEAILKNLEDFSIKLNPTPLRKANFSVLKLPSVPSILIETGFMSTSSDLKNLQDRDWAEKFALAISSGILEWVAEDQLLGNKRMQ